MRSFRYINMIKLKLKMNQIFQHACNTRCIPKPIHEIIISLLMKFQDDQRCVTKCQFHQSFQFLHPISLCLTHSLFKLKPKIYFYPSMFYPNKFFQLSLFVWLHFSNLNFTFGCSFNFQSLINVIGNYENYTKNEDFYFGGLVLHTKIYLDNILNGY
jgi:hypothetical protein